MKIFRYLFLLCCIFLFGYSTSLPQDISYNQDYEYYSDDEFEEYEETVIIDDRFEKVNRKVFNFNKFFIDYLISPIGRGYKKIVPDFVRASISNFLNLLKEPLTFSNSILQLDFENASKSIVKIHTNLVVGVFGTRNIAKNFKETNSLQNDFVHTLAFFGFPSGPFLMIPFFCPYYVRDGIGQSIDYFGSTNINNNSNVLNNKIANNEESRFLFGSLDILNKIDTIETLDRTLLSKSFDPYIMMRNSYIELRKNKLLELTNRGK